MTKFCKLFLQNRLIWVALTIILALLISIVFLNPIWSRFSPPFDIIRIFPAITAPVDGPFYIINAEKGYQWNLNNPIYLWFHPLLSILISVMPKWFNDNIWFWIISIFSSFGCLFFALLISKIFTHLFIPLYLLPFILIIPGGLSIATGNPEIPTLLFTSLLLISVIYLQKWWLTILFAVLGIFTKPNTLYMVPILFVYFFSGSIIKDKELSNQSLLGIISIILGWVVWILIVDWHTGYLGSYWKAREISSNFVAGNPINFFLSLVNSFKNTGDLRDQIRYSSALLIPLFNIWLIGMIPFSKESHRIAQFMGNIAMLSIALIFGNPNKIIVYTTTVPGYFSIYLLMINNFFNIKWMKKPINKYIVIPIFTLFCLGMLIVYVFGTPLGWYY